VVNNTFRMTFFNSLYDNDTSQSFEKRNWTKFCCFLEELSKLKYTKQSAPLISPAVYREGTTRSNANVEAWGGWCALDIDSHPFQSRKDIEAYMDKNHKDKAYCCYSTASSSKQKPKFRLVFPTGGWVSGEEKIRKFWFALNKEFSDLADKQTKDISRMYFIPAEYQESDNNFFWWQEGNPIIPAILIDKHGIDEVFSTSGNNFLDMLPEKMKASVIKYREQQLKSDGKYYTWKSYRDCPFVKKEQVLEYKSIATSGREGRYRGLYQLMVSIAGAAISRQYPITPYEIVELVMEIDNDIDGYYRNRKITIEAERALAFVYRNH
jgi:hypothetical protein